MDFPEIAPGKCLGGLLRGQFGTSGATAEVQLGYHPTEIDRDRWLEIRQAQTSLLEFVEVSAPKLGMSKGPIGLDAPLEEQFQRAGHFLGRVGVRIGVKCCCKAMVRVEQPSVVEVAGDLQQLEIAQRVDLMCPVEDAGMVAVVVRGRNHDQPSGFE